MFSLIKKAVILVLMSVSSVMTNKNCLLLKNQDCKVRKVIIGNDYMTFPYKINVDKCLGSCNDVEHLYFKVCTPDIVKNIRIKRFNLISRKNVLKNVTFHKSCKCSCLLDEKVCNNKQKWNKDKRRCECLEIKDCDIGFPSNVVNCSYEKKKMAALIVEGECDVETSEKRECNAFPENKTITLIKK